MWEFFAYFFEMMAWLLKIIIRLSSGLILPIIKKSSQSLNSLYWALIDCFIRISSIILKVLMCAKNISFAPEFFTISEL